MRKLSGFYAFMFLLVSRLARNESSLTDSENFSLVSCSQVPMEHYYSQEASYDYDFRGTGYEIEGYRSQMVVCPCCHFGGKKE